MTRLLLVKHSLVEIDETVPAHEWILSSEGRERAHRLAKKLTSFNPEAIVSSVEPKARQTAEIIAEECGVSVQAMDDLREHERSHVPFLQRDKFETLVQEFFEKPDVLVFGNETATRALDRFQKAVDAAIQTTNADLLAVVSHGTVISLFVAAVTGCDGFLLWQELELPSCVVLDVETNLMVEKIYLD